MQYFLSVLEYCVHPSRIPWGSEALSGTVYFFLSFVTHVCVYFHLKIKGKINTGWHVSDGTERYTER